MSAANTTTPYRSVDCTIALYKEILSLQRIMMIDLIGFHFNNNNNNNNLNILFTSSTAINGHASFCSTQFWPSSNVNYCWIKTEIVSWDEKCRCMKGLPTYQRWHENETPTQWWRHESQWWRGTRPVTRFPTTWRRCRATQTDATSTRAPLPTARRYPTQQHSVDQRHTFLLLSGLRAPTTCPLRVPTSPVDKLNQTKTTPQPESETHIYIYRYTNCYVSNRKKVDSYVQLTFRGNRAIALFAFEALGRPLLTIQQTHTQLYTEPQHTPTRRVASLLLGENSRYRLCRWWSMCEMPANRH